MTKTPATKESDEAVIKIIENNILRYTVQLFYKTENGLRPFGSGVLALIHDTHFILTASHVADHIEENGNDLFIRIGKKRFVNILGEIKFTDIQDSKGVDLAYIKLDHQLIPDLSKSYKFITIDKFRKHMQQLDAMNYCVVGFPEKNIKFGSGTMETGASFYLTGASNDKPYKYYKLSKEDFFIVDMKGKGTDIKTGHQDSIDSHFYGISGCGLWYIMYILDTVTNQYSVDYRLIGIMTEFRKGKYFCLIGNKIHLILQASTVIEGFKFKEIAVS